MKRDFHKACYNPDQHFTNASWKEEMFLLFLENNVALFERIGERRILRDLVYFPCDYLTNIQMYLG